LHRWRQQGACDFIQAILDSAFLLGEEKHFHFPRFVVGVPTWAKMADTCYWQDSKRRICWENKTPNEEKRPGKVGISL